jgi:hypothetical protein
LQLLSYRGVGISSSVKSHLAAKMMIAQKPLPGKLANRFEALPEAWLQNELFEQASDYLARGRRFETLNLDQLNEAWAIAFRQFVGWQLGPGVHDLDDAGAELRLRGAEFPTHLVMWEVEQLRSRYLSLASTWSMSGVEH